MHIKRQLINIFMIKSRFLEVFDDLPESVGAYENEMPGYKVAISYDPERLYFREVTTHLDTKIANRVWISIASIEKRNDTLVFDVSNEYAEPADKYRDTKTYYSVVLISMVRLLII